MNGAGIRDYNGPVELLELPDPVILEPEQVLLEVRAAGVGNWDGLVRSGDWNVGLAPPMALGVEAAGVVRRVGSAVRRFGPGDEVLTHSVPLSQQGAWAQLLVAPERHLAQKPAGMSFPVAGLFAVPALVAQQALVTAVHVRAGETVLIHGAGGISGGLLVAVAAGLGARVIATAGPASAERVRGAGAFAVLDYHAPDWPTRARDLAGGRVPVAVNAVRRAAASLVGLVADDGRLATITGDPPPAERGIRGSDVYVEPDGTSLERLAADFTGRGLTIPVARVSGLAEAPAALSDVVAGRSGGGVVIDPRR
jgi:NADPH:quinone reductase-like Zn-dependent oxidoreductase